MATIGTSSRFAALHIEEISEDEEKSSNVKESNIQKKSNAEKNAKKKARKKKKAAVEHEVTNELRNLAFSKPVSAKAVQHVHQQRHNIPDISTTNVEETIKNTNNKTSENDIPTWEEWKNKDEEFVVDQFQRDLEIAMRLSSADLERSQKNLEENSRSKKKSSKKQPTMSLDEFTSMNIPKTSYPSETITNTLDSYTLLNGYIPEEIDPHHYYLDIPEDNKEPIIPISQQNGHTSQNKKHKKKKKKTIENKPLSEVFTELHQDEKIVQPTNLIDRTSLITLQNVLEEKEKELEDLRNELEATKTELSQVKKRNKQLCIIMAQGEMKEKSEILQQVDELTSVKNELSEELSEMYSSLEQERSKVSTLKNELTKYHSGRMKTKSISDEK